MNLTQQINAGQSKARRFIAREHKLLIDGRWVGAESAQLIEVRDPATGEIIAHVPAGGAADINRAVIAARRAFEEGPWSKLNGSARAKLLWKLGDIIERNVDELAVIETYDVGVPIRSTRLGSIGTSPDVARYLSGWAGRIYGETVPATSGGEWHIYTVREPCGVVGQIIPWNVPFAMAVAKVCAALAAGCTVVVKPAEQTPLSTLRLGEMILEAGIPEGAVNIVTGLGGEAGAALVNHPNVDKITFTGSTATGKAILRASSDSLKRVTLELGGKSPVIILADADLDRAIPGAAHAVFFNSGQTCVAGSRLFVAPKIVDRVVAGLVEHAAQLKVGPGIDPENDLGPLVSERQLRRVLGFIDSGTKGGAQVAHGGTQVGEKGYFVAPTVFVGAKPEMPLAREEIFGPVLSVLPVTDDSLEGLARQANETEYGLAATIWTRDISAAHRLAGKLKAGSIRINSSGSVDPAVPFGGYKQSGIGRERGREGVEIYTELKSVLVSL